MGQFLTLKDLADMLGIDRGNLWKKVKKDRVKTVKEALAILAEMGKTNSKKE